MLHDDSPALFQSIYLSLYPLAIRTCVVMNVNVNDDRETSLCIVRKNVEVTTRDCWFWEKKNTLVTLKPCYCTFITNHSWICLCYCLYINWYKNFIHFWCRKLLRGVDWYMIGIDAIFFILCHEDDDRKHRGKNVILRLLQSVFFLLIRSFFILLDDWCVIVRDYGCDLGDIWWFWMVIGGNRISGNPFFVWYPLGVRLEGRVSRIRIAFEHFESLTLDWL